MSVELIFTALALVLILEGLFYAAFPNFMLKALEQLGQVPAEKLRLGGILAACIGVVFLYILRL
jgi:uncharacterized protein YjeT (DUF2065 family)